MAQFHVFVSTTLSNISWQKWPWNASSSDSVYSKSQSTVVQSQWKSIANICILFPTTCKELQVHIWSKHQNELEYIFFHFLFFNYFTVDVYFWHKRYLIFYRVLLWVWRFAWLIANASLYKGKIWYLIWFQVMLLSRNNQRIFYMIERKTCYIANCNVSPYVEPSPLFLLMVKKTEC